MNKYIAVLKSDAKNTFRDPSLLMILFLPLLIIAVLQFGFPALLKYVPGAIDYGKEIVVFLSLVSAVMPAIVMSFILLDEKDIQLFPVMKVTSVSFSGFLLVRLFLLISIGFIVSMIILYFNGIIYVNPLQAIQFSILSGLNSPILALLIAHFAKNKIEGLTLMKISNVVLIIPIMIFFLHSKWEYALGVFPAFWPYKFFDTANSFFVFVAGIIFLLLVNYAVFKYMVKHN